VEKVAKIEKMISATVGTSVVKQPFIQREDESVTDDSRT